jgi:hypothetical protein
MTPNARAAIHALTVIETCMVTLHDLAAQSPYAAAEVIDALQRANTPAALDAARQVRRVAEARHGSWRIREGQR